jgi:muramoyltetrapeptide carboxypeptidase
LAALTLAPALSPGDAVAVVAPSSPFPRDELWRGLAWLRARYRLRAAGSIFSRAGYLAGDDARRTKEMASAMLDDDVKAIVAVRGGYGAMRIAQDLPWEAFARRPKWIVGFSDITSLHVMAWRSGVASIHAPNVTGLGRDASVATRASWLAALERPTAAGAWRGLKVVRGGEARGIIVGGNLALVHAMAAAGRLLLPESCVLALEDVGEAPYRVDRMLTSLRLGGHLAKVSALVLGGFDRCEAGADGRRVEDLFAEQAESLAIPVLAGAPFGHGATNLAFVLGATARIRGDEVIFGDA